MTENILSGSYEDDGAKIMAYKRQGKLKLGAAKAFQAKYPEDILSNALLAELLLNQGVKVAALPLLEKVVALSGFSPQHVDSLTRLYIELGFFENALIMLKQAQKLHPKSAMVSGNLSQLHAVIGHAEESLRHMNDALHLTGDETHRLALKKSLAELYRTSNRKDEARALLLEITAIPAEKIYGLSYQAVVDDPKLDSPLMAEIDAVLSSEASKLSVFDEERLRLAYGRAAEKSGKYDLAFENWGKARSLKPSKYDAQRVTSLFEKNAGFYTRDLFKKMAPFAHKTKAPFFVMGMPRSGTTLVEQILSMHPKCVGIGELGRPNARTDSFIEQYAQPGGVDALFSQALKGKLMARAQDFLRLAGVVANKTGAEHFVDKTPTQFLAAGYIHLCMPHAKFINCLRHPADIFISTYQNHFTEGFTYVSRQEDFAHYFLLKQRYLKLWHEVMGEQILDVRYEELVSDPEPQIRRILDFLDLQWDPAVLRPHESGNVVRTFSSNQVRSAINTKSIGRWRNYEKHLGPLFAALEKAGYSYPESEA